MKALWYGRTTPPLPYLSNGEPVARHLAKHVIFLVVRELGYNLLVGVIKPLEAERQLGNGQVTPTYAAFWAKHFNDRQNPGATQSECQSNPKIHSSLR